ncbi:helicase-related protein [Deinococcus roseus]|uniref:helicase-related protein n=1 Tax=Deinococcus roseus TaxID=392414 RepID=UPI00166C37AC|nr:helicase-related protein [Deinococcus roseus]
MPKPIPDYTDNEQHFLHQVLSNIITEYDQKRLDIATGFFSPNVWALLKDSFEQLNSLRLIIGKQLEAKLDRSGVDLARMFKKQLRAELESEEFNSRNAQVIDSLISFLKRDAVQVRMFDDPFLHAKAYIFDSYTIVGSSNLTLNGLSHNSELNTVTKQDFYAKCLRNEWYDRFWARSKEYKADLIEVLEKSKFGKHPYTPFDVFLKVLFELYKDTLSSPEEASQQVIELAAFQTEGFRLACKLIEQFGCVMVADAVGLGKSFLGLSLLEEYVVRRRKAGFIPRALVVCPAQLERLVWEPLLERFAIPATVVSMESMGREDFDWRKYVNCDVVLVDESHNFRKPGTGRYTNLMRVISAGKTDKIVALLTATPVNNSIMDLYHQVRLMTRGRESIYAGVGIPDLGIYFKKVAGGRAEFYDFAEHALVRRSRRDVKRRQEQGEKILISGKEIRFPERTLHRIEYSLFDQLGGFYEGFIQRIEGLRLVAYNLEKYKKKEQDDREVIRREALTGIFKTNFLKRLESSVHAFSMSVKNQMEFQKRFYRLLQEHKFLDAGSNRKIEQILRFMASEDDLETNQKLQKLLDALPQVDSKLYDWVKLENDLKKDLEALEWMVQKVQELLTARETHVGKDSKLEEIKNALLQRLKGQETHGKKAIIFSYYHDTADYLYKGLIQDQDWLNDMGQPVIAMISGSTRAEDRNLLIQRFAPKANRGDLDDEAFAKILAQPVDILVCTDVLSEGQNLQDAGFLLNADLHWNPVRMIQRAGRIDRLGSEYETLQIHNVFPERGLDELLKLVSRLEERIWEIDRTVGLDASVLGEAISTRSLDELRRIHAGDQEVLDELEQESELSAADEMRLPLLSALQLIGREYVDELPLGIHSAKAAPENARGVFIALRVGQQMLWRVYPMDLTHSDVMVSRREVYRLIEASQEVPRSAEPAGTAIYPYLTWAIEGVIQESKRQVRKQAFKAPLKGMALDIYRLLSDIKLEFEPEVLDPRVLVQLRYTLEERSLAAYEKEPDLREILKNLKEEGDFLKFVLGLQAFFLDQKLLLEPAGNRITLQEIKENDITLVAYEWLV